MELSGVFDQASGNLQTAKLSKAAQVSGKSAETARKTAVEFEGFFIAMALENMFSGIETEGLFGGGQGEKVFRSMMLQDYGKTIAERSSIGIADAVQREIIRLQEVQKK
jgi:Rod binding domain-containing protein